MTMRIHASDSWIRIRILPFEATFTSFFKDKSQKEGKNGGNQDFSYYFCLMFEASGSVPVTNGSGSRRLKNLRILWSRICNTAGKADQISQS
jgi:hypothetical protein